MVQMSIGRNVENESLRKGKSSTPSPSLVCPTPHPHFMLLTFLPFDIRTLHLMKVLKQCRFLITSKAFAISMIVLKRTFFRYLPMAQIAEADPKQINQVKYINRLDYPFSLSLVF
jgi:hypothetical protein